MRLLPIIALLMACAACQNSDPNTNNSTAAQPTAVGKAMQEKTALQLYSLRDQFAKDVPGTFDFVAKTLKIKEIEHAGFYGKTAAAYKAELDRVGLVPKGGFYSFGEYRDSIQKIVADCKALGIDHVGCAWIDHEDNNFGRADAEKAIKVFNDAAKVLAANGITFYYHTHGYEFKPAEEGGTLFDLMAKNCDPAQVKFELDTYWVHHAGVRVTDLLQKYGNRFYALHIKDMRKGEPTGLFTGHSDVSNSVVLGTGQLDMPAILKKALEVGVQKYFIEDENANVQAQLPLSIAYLYGL
jgi:sugar phosphate isomerase/epimerase